MATSTTGDMPTTTSMASEASCTTATPGKNGWVPLDACNSQYPYNPIFAADCAFAVLFGLTTATHVVQAVAWRKRFCWVLLVGASWEFIAFVMKTLGAKAQQNIGYVIPGQLLFLLAPLWINAFAYMTVARLVYFASSDQGVFRIRAITLTKLFVWIDILCFLVQGAGGAMMSNTDVSPEDQVVRIGQKVYIGGCAAQLFFVLLFCAVITRLQVKISRERRSDLPLRRVRLLTWVMLVVLVLIIVRVIFRLVEFSPGVGSSNHMASNELYALTLDALPMLLAFLLLNLVHPGWVLRGPNSEFPPKEKKERKEKQKEVETL